MRLLESLNVENHYIFSDEKKIKHSSFSIEKHGSPKKKKKKKNKPKDGKSKGKRIFIIYNKHQNLKNLILT